MQQARHRSRAWLSLLFTSPLFAQGIRHRRPHEHGPRRRRTRSRPPRRSGSSAARSAPGCRRDGVELSLDRRSAERRPHDRVRDYPLQGSLLLFPIHSTFSPYVLGGVGWYTHVVDTLAAGQVTATDSSRKMGYHAGFGGELKVGGHAGVHADYRYTILHFDDSNPRDSLRGWVQRLTGALASRFLPSYDGSMWTAGLTFYF